MGDVRGYLWPYKKDCYPIAMFIGPYAMGYTGTNVPTGYDRVLEKEPLYFDSKPIIAYRSWDVKVDADSNFWLESLYKDATWPRYATHSALCAGHYFIGSREKRAPVLPYAYINPDDLTKKAWGEYEHDAPDSLHDCGIYAYKEIKLSRYEIKSGIRKQRVSGEVYLWGKVLVHEDGYKAQYAYPKTLWIPEELADQVDFELEDLVRGLTANYGINWIPWPKEAE